MAIDAQMQKVVKDIMKMQAKVAQECRAQHKRPWLNFADVNEAGQFDFVAVHKIFTRKASNDEYVSLHADPKAKAKDLQTAKLSHDFLAQCERDYRARTRSRVRTMVHAAVMSTESTSKPEGSLQRNTLDWMGRILTERSEQT